MSKIVEQKTNTNNRCIGLDVLKCLSAFFIIMCHCRFSGEAIDYVIGWSRFAVPVFFMITGFFYSSTVKRNKEKLQIKKIFFLLIVSNVIYFLFNGALAFLKGDFITYIKGIANPQSLFEFLVLNESPFAGHLWYLSAILYTLIIVYIVNRFKKLHILNLLIPVLLLGDLLLGKYSILIFGQEFSYLWVRNFLFVGLPYFLLGNLINKHQDKLHKIFTKPILIACIAVFSVTAVLERFILISIDMSSAREHFISTTFLAVLIFLVALKFYSTEKTPRAINFLAQIGKRYSAWIYILHPMVITMFNIVFKSVLAKIPFLQYVVPFIVFVAVCVFIVLFNKFYNFVIKCISAKKNAD